MTFIPEKAAYWFVLEMADFVFILFVLAIQKAVSVFS